MTDTTRTLAVIIPAHNEAGYIEQCLNALIASEPVPNTGQTVLVVANACRDNTAELASGLRDEALARGWTLGVIQTDTPGKLNALNIAEDALSCDITVYLDADVIVSPNLISQLAGALDSETARYASGTPRVLAPRHPLIRAYARFWGKLPFVSQGVPGFGIFAVNAAGRARWGRFPDIISDDTYVRLQFSPDERVRLAATYSWPMVSGIGDLIRVRRRQDVGVKEVRDLFPPLSRNAEPARPGLAQTLRMTLRDPFGFLAYGIISAMVRLPVLRSQARWVRGR